MEAMSETEISVQFQVIGRWRTLCHMVRDDGTGEWRVEQKLSERQSRMHHRHAQGALMTVTIQRAPRGQKRFLPEFVEVEWR